MIPYTYNRRTGEMTTPCPFGQRVSGLLKFTYGEGDIVRVGSNACVGCPEFAHFFGHATDGVMCRRENQ